MFLKFSISLAFCLTSFCCFAFPHLDELSIEEKVGQILMIHFNGEQANHEAKTLIQEAHVGSIMYYNWSNGLNSPTQVRKLSNELQKIAKQNPHPIPLLIATDQEGGVVSRLTNGFTIFPGNKALGMTHTSTLAEQAAYIMGEELQAVGINMNLSPVVDVNSNAKNPVIGIRAYSNSADEVVNFAKKTLAGYHTAGIITTLKHFPGHGDVETDSHEDLPLVKKTLQELYQTELKPFAKLAHNTDVIMTAHVIVRALDPVYCTTLSKDSLNFLRTQLGFQGVIISDSLVMEGLLKNCESIDEASIQAFNAGCDIVMLGGKQLIGAHKDLEMTVADSLRIHQALVYAVKTGRISEEKLNLSVQRILDLKERYLTKTNPFFTMPLENVVDTKEHRTLAKDIANRSIHIQKNTPFSLDLESSQITVITPKITKTTIESTSLCQLNKKTNCLFFEELNPSDKEMTEIEKAAIDRDLTIFCSYNAWKNDKQALLIQNLINQNKPFILIVLRDPLDASLFPLTHFVITTFSPTAPSIQAAADQITKPNFWH